MNLFDLDCGETVNSTLNYEPLSPQLKDIECTRAEPPHSSRQWAKTQRLLRTAENVALAANLFQTADGAMQQRYEALVASESGTLVKLQLIHLDTFGQLSHNPPGLFATNSW